MRLALEIEGQEGQLEPPRGGGELAAFLSFAVSRGFGAQHPFLALADLLHDEHGVRMGPLTTFYEAEAEDAEDEAKLALAWQPARELRESLEAVVRALDIDPAARTFAARAGAPGLRDAAAALLPALCRAEAAVARVRLSYRL